MRDLVTFKSDLFNLTEEKSYFINPGCFGDDLANWLIEKLKARGLEVDDKAGQEDFGWYVAYAVDGQAHCAVIGTMEGEGWFIVIERQVGLWGSMLGHRHKRHAPVAIESIDAVLKGESRVSDVRWFTWKEFQTGGKLENGAPAPAG